MPKCYQAIIKAPFSHIGIQIADEKLIGLTFLFNVKTKSSQDSFLKIIIAQLQQYFHDPYFKFDLPLALNGTPYQRKVWQALQKIPVGKTQSYGELAQQINSGARAIGNACRRNPLPIIIPCHRIIRSNKTLGGFSGARVGQWPRIKQWLLQHENVTIHD